MDSMSIDFSKLAQETFELNSAQHSEETEVPEEILSEELYLASGLIYRIEQSTGTFCVRGIETEDIGNYLENDQNRDHLFHNLRIVSSEDLDGICYFETETVEIAKKIKNNILNKRFPYDEDMICNLSDPGFSWWMEDGSSSLKIYFKLHGVASSELYRLGPIGNVNEINKIFNDGMIVIKALFNISEFYCNEKSLGLTVDRESPYFDIIKGVFLDGLAPVGLESFFSMSVYPQMYSYLIELASIRKFWITIENKFSI